MDRLPQPARGELFPVHDQGRAAAKELEQVHQVLLFQLGLRFANGEAKPGVYDAFRMPAFMRLLQGGRVEIFGGLRAASGGSALLNLASGSLPFARLCPAE